ncbi:MAG: hypothetical protein LBK56_06395 [Gracilibacteraceae bacterium]|jgi:phosphate butyryltransferase|nr:hypothetical protein [Gracilibacteraceae bacterium]
MIYKNFDSLTAKVLKHGKKLKCTVVMPEDERTIEAVLRAQSDGLIQPVLIGDQKKIENCIENCLFAIGDVRDPSLKIYNEKYAEAAVCLAIDMVYGGDSDCIMNGSFRPREFIRRLLKKELHFATGNIISMLSFRELPNYHKIIAFTDTGICPHPNLEQKRAIIENAVTALHAMKINNPKVAVLASTDVPDAKMPASIDAAALKKLNEDGLLPGCVVEGPIALDQALSSDAARFDGFNSPVAGDADLLVFPDLDSASITSKAITYITGKPPGVLVLGTKAPVIQCSRASSVETKYLGIVLAVAGEYNWNLHKSAKSIKTKRQAV